MKKTIYSVLALVFAVTAFGVPQAKAVAGDNDFCIIADNVTFDLNGHESCDQGDLFPPPEPKEPCFKIPLIIYGHDITYDECGGN